MTVSACSLLNLSLDHIPQIDLASSWSCIYAIHPEVVLSVPRADAQSIFAKRGSHKGESIDHKHCLEMPARIPSGRERSVQ